MPVTSSVRHTAANSIVSNSSTPDGTIALNELDNHADTICVGRNWRVLEYTGELCSVIPFSKDYDPTPNIPVARCATTYTCPDSGQSILLIADQVLYFGDSMDHTLINPHQIRSHGYSLCDDPWDPNRTLGLDTEHFFIPFFTTGSTVHFASAFPSRWDLDNLPAIQLTAPHWDPSAFSMPNTHRPVPRFVDALSTLSESACFLSSISPSLDERCFPALLSATMRTAAAVTGTGKRITASAIGTERHSPVTPEGLASKWGIGLDLAKRTLQVTTQQGIRTAIHPLHRRYRVDHLHLNRKRLNGDWFTDTLFSKVESIQGNTCAQVFTNGTYTSVHPMSSKSHVAKALTEFTDDVGIPDNLTSDGAPEIVGRHTEFTKEVNRMKIRMRRAEVGRSNQNYAAEREIGELKKRWRNRMLRQRVPKRLWDYGLVYEANILNRIPRGKNARTGLETVTGETPDISEWMDFGFYDRVWVYDHKKIELDGTGRRLARWLGVAHRVGSDLCYWLLLSTGHVVARTTVQHVTREDILNGEIKVMMTEFDDAIATRLDDQNFQANNNGDTFFIQDDYENDGLGEPDTTPTLEEYDDMIVPDLIDEEEDDGLFDKYLNAELMFDVGTGEERRGRVTKRAKGLAGEAIGRAHSNPLFDTRQYVVEFTDGTVENYFANVIAENMYAQVDSEGNQYQLLDEIIDHKSDDSAIKIGHGFTRSRNGNMVPKTTTRGWSLLVSWKDGSTEWIKLKDIKDSYPVQIAEYATNNGISGEPAFNWWVHSVMKKKDRIIAKVKSRYWRTTHKFGIRLPKTVEEALRIDDETGTDFWRKAIGREMSKVKVAWRSNDKYSPSDVRQGKASDMIGFQEIKCHVIFDVKMDFTRKARFVAGGHMTDTPGSITYSSVVSRDSVRLAFLIAGLNGLDVLAGDVTLAYLNAPCREKIWFEGQVENGEERGKVLIVTRALYGLKSSGAAWRAEFAGTLRDMGFASTKADPDVWIRSATDHYEMILVYVDDILVFAQDPQKIMIAIGECYELKPESVKEPDIYLGANMEKVQLPNGKTEWAMSPRTYIKSAIKVVETMLVEDGDEMKLKSTAKNPFPNGYRPELDISTELNDEMATRFMQLVGILRWAVELGRIDICTELSQLSQHQSLPRRGHLEAAYHIFAYLKKHDNGGRIVFDPITPVIDVRSLSNAADWTDFYGDVAEELPPQMPEPKGKTVTTSCFVDANHAGNVVTRRSHTGILIYVQNAPIIWYSKRQNTVEASSFGSEFVALRIAKEMIVALRYKLRMFGVPIDGPTNVFCDNNGVVKNTSIPHSTLLKKHNAINYHAVREAVAAQIIRVIKEDGMTNLADLFTKILTADRRRALCRHIQY
jgi:hypothetical protein